MEIQVAITQVHNADVAVVWVNRYAIPNEQQARAYSRQLEVSFAMPVVLASSDRDRKTLWFSQHEDLLASISMTPLLNLPWGKYDVA